MRKSSKPALASPLCPTQVPLEHLAGFFSEHITPGRFPRQSECAGEASALGCLPRCSDYCEQAQVCVSEAAMDNVRGTLQAHLPLWTLRALRKAGTPTWPGIPPLQLPQP